MAITDSEYQARRLAALEKFEAAADKLHDFVNLATGETITTENGDIPTVATIADAVLAYEVNITAVIDNTVVTMDALPTPAV